MNTPLKAKLLQVFGGLLMFIGALVAASPKISRVFDLGLELPNLALLVGAGIGMAGLGFKSLRHGKKLVAKDASSLRAEDRRSPVLYLRSFALDAMLSEPSGHASRTSTEEDLVEALSDFGPVIAIGRPGERLPTLGAARMYMDQEHWKDDVQELISKARKIVLLAGSSPGLLWEIEQSINIGRPTDLLVVVANSKATYATYLAMTSHLFPSPLPNHEAVFIGLRFFESLVGLHIRAIICFDERWRPVLVPVTFRFRFWKYMNRANKGALTPSFRAAVLQIPPTIERSNL